MSDENTSEVKPEVEETKRVYTPYIKLRGLPFSINEEEIREFFGDLTIKRVKILAGFNGKSSGEAMVEMGSNEDAGKAMGLDRKEIKKRYIEVFSAPLCDGEGAFKAAAGGGENDGFIVRLRGVPWSCTEHDVKEFFEGLETTEVIIGTVGGPGTKATGEAFAKFATIEQSQTAMEYNNRHMGSRYIEVFQSNKVEWNRAKGIPVPESYQRTGIRPLMASGHDTYYNPPAAQHHYDYSSAGRYADPYAYDAYSAGYDPYGAGAHASYGGNVGYDEQAMRLYMRGLPFDADAHAVEAFFSPIHVVAVKLGITESNRASGDAIAEFNDYNDMVSAMSRNNHRIGRRYVELFYTRDAPGNMKKLMWKEASGPNVGAAPALDPVINGWSNKGNTSNRTPIGPVMPEEHRGGYGPGRGRGGPPMRGPSGHEAAAARAARDAWAAYGYDTSAQWPAAHDPYADRQREAHPHHDPSAASWGSYPQY